jgi:glycerate kinase
VLRATSYGTGQLIKDALARGCRKIYFGLGGSATNDAGAGMMQALGVKYLDKEGKEVNFENAANAACGGKLGEVMQIDISGMDKRIYDTEFVVLSDVKNVLCGEQGASYVFGPQKGASPEQVRLLDANLKHFGVVMEGVLKKPVLSVHGSGAAGGIGASAVGFLSGKVCSGIDALLDILEIDKHLADTDLVVTGEGRIDYQTAYGKVPVGIAKRAKKAALYGERKIPVVAIVGSVGERFEEVYEHGIDKVYLISEEKIPLEESIRRGLELIENTAERIAKAL